MTATPCESYLLLKRETALREGDGDRQAMRTRTTGAILWMLLVWGRGGVDVVATSQKSPGLWHVRVWRYGNRCECQITERLPGAFMAWLVGTPQWLVQLRFPSNPARMVFSETT